jgi:hypothetical protein
MATPRQTINSYKVSNEVYNPFLSFYVPLNVALGCAERLADDDLSIYATPKGGMVAVHRHSLQAVQLGCIDDLFIS